MKLAKPARSFLFLGSPALPGIATDLKYCCRVDLIARLKSLAVETSVGCDAFRHTALRFTWLVRAVTSRVLCELSLEIESASGVRRLYLCGRSRTAHVLVESYRGDVLAVTSSPHWQAVQNFEQGMKYCEEYVTYVTQQFGYSRQHATARLQEFYHLWDSFEPGKTSYQLDCKILDKNLVVTDGFHRLAISRSAGEETIGIRVPIIRRLFSLSRP